MKEKRKVSFIDSGFGQFLNANKFILAGLIILCVILYFFNPVFIKFENISNVLRQTSINLNLALAMTMVIILGGIDLSVGAVIALVGVITTSLITNNGMPLPVALIAGALVGVAFGAFNGAVVANTKIPPFIVTLATMNIARGVAYVYTGGKPIRVMASDFNFIGAGYLFGVIPMPVLYTVILLIFSSLVMNKSKLGRYIYAVGGNKQAARFSGIKIKRVEFFAYTFAGFMAAVSGIVLSARMFSGQPTAGEGAELDAIAAVVLGGTSMSGGSGKISGTVIGALIMGVLSNGLNLMRVQSFWQYVVKGIVILIAVFIDVRKKKD